MSKYWLVSLIFICSLQAHAQTPPDESNTDYDVQEEVDHSTPEDHLEEASKSNVKSDYSPVSEGEKPSSGSGEKIFDWSKHQNEKEVAHPFAEKGLIRITKDRTYIYKVEETEQKRAASFGFGIFDPKNLTNPDSDGAGSTFADNYDQTSSPAILFAYEWQLLQGAIGKIGLRAGTGAYIAQGNGHFKTGSVNTGKTPREIFTFVAMPNSAGLVYRAQFWEKQLFVPYAEGGGIAFTFAEVRDDSKPPKVGGSLAGYAAGGVALNLTYFDNSARIQLDREYGINRVYLTVEYRTIVAITQRYDFTSDLINAGFLMEF